MSEQSRDLECRGRAGDGLPEEIADIAIVAAAIFYTLGYS
jgi:hypothetical protein